MVRIKGHPGSLVDPHVLELVEQATEKHLLSADAVAILGRMRAVHLDLRSMRTWYGLPSL